MSSGRLESLQDSALLVVIGATVYAVGPINIIFKTSPDGITSIEVMRLTSTGNVSIGTNNPQQKLDVNGTIGTSHGLTIGGTPQIGAWSSRTPLSNSLTSVDTFFFPPDPTSLTIGADGLPS